MTLRFEKRLIQGDALYAPRRVVVDLLFAVLWLLLSAGLFYLQDYAWDSVVMLVYGSVALVYWLRLLFCLYRYGPLGPPLLKIQDGWLIVSAAMGTLNRVRRVDLNGVGTMTVYGPLHLRSQRLDYVDGRQIEVEMHWKKADETIVVEFLRRYLAHSGGRVLVKPPPGLIAEVRGEYDADVAE